MTTFLGAETITRRRYAATSWGTDGRPVLGTSTDTSIVASVQVATGEDLQRLPEGFRSAEAIRVFTATELRVGDQRSKLEADRLVRGSIVYQVQHVEPEHPLIQHYEAIATRMAEVLS